MSKASAQGLALAKKAQAMQEVVDPGVVTADRDATGAQGGAAAGQFERKFIARDKMDDTMNTKMQLMDGEGMTPFGQVLYDDKVAKWLERKEGALEAADFDAYFNENFNKSDLASRQFAQQLNPEFYAAREREMDERVELVKALKKIQLRGPQSQSDLYNLWLIESGRVQLPPNWDTIGLSYDKKPNPRVQEYRFKQGLIKMPLFLSPEQTTVGATENIAQKAWGNRAVAGSRFMGRSVWNGTGDNTPLEKAPNTFNEKFLSFLK